MRLMRSHEGERGEREGRERESEHEGRSEEAGSMLGVVGLGACRLA